MTDELKIAVMALRNILEPIKYLQDKAKEDGAKLDGYMAIQLTQNASLYQEIARKALEAIDTVLSEIDAQTRYIKLLEDGILDMQNESENGFCVKFNNEEFMQSIQNREETK